MSVLGLLYSLFQTSMLTCKAISVCVVIKCLNLNRNTIKLVLNDVKHVQNGKFCFLSLCPSKDLLCPGCFVISIVQDKVLKMDCPELGSVLYRTLSVVF